MDNPRFAGSTLKFHRRRPLFWLALWVCGGIACDSFVQPALSTVGGLSLAAVFVAGLLLCLRRGVLSAPHAFACAAGIAFSAGMLLHALSHRIPRADDLSRRTSVSPSLLFLAGTLVEVGAESRPGAVRLWTVAVEKLGPDSASATNASGLVQLRVQTSTAPGATLAEGDRVSFRARIEAPPEVTVPGSFDYAAYLERRGIRRTGAVFPESIENIGRAWWRIDLALRRSGAALARRIEAALPEHPAQAALLNAQLFGRRERLDVSDREAFAISGAAHLLAISGLQIQFLAWLLFLALARLRVNRRRAAWIVMALSCAYCALAGSDAPILRSTVMIVLYLSAIALWREPDPLSVLGAAALLILALTPAELFNAGFQLSFLAVFSLLTIYPALEEAWAAWRSPPLPPVYPEPLAWRTLARQALRKTLLVSLAAWLGTAPCVAWHMGRFATYSLLTNIVAVPLSSACMIAGIVVLGLGTLSSAAAILAGYPALALVGLLQVLSLGVASLPGSSIDLNAPATAVLLVYAGVLSWIWISRGTAVGVWRTAVLVLSCLALLCSGAFFEEGPPLPCLTVLDVNYGRASLVESPSGAAAMIDAGGVGQGLRLAEMLRRKGIGRLALLVVTADEADTLGGAVELLSRIPVARVILPHSSGASPLRRELEQFLAARGIPYGPPDTAQALYGPGDVRWEFADDGLAGEQRALAKTALCLRLSLPGTRVLFLDARSAAALQRLLAKSSDAALSADVLLACAGEGGRWPAELATAVRRSGCRTLIAEGDFVPAESPGLDLVALTSARHILLLSPRQHGSLKVEADALSGKAQPIQAYGNGLWRTVE